MITSFTQLYPTATVTYIQSTYVELATAVELHRVDIRGKVEARLRRGTGGVMAYDTRHPSLKLYSEPLGQLRLLHRPGSADALLAAIDHLIARLPGGWRDQWLRFQSMDPQAAMRRVVERGQGYLLHAVPESLAQEMEALCWLHGAETLLETGRPLPSPLRERVVPPLAVLLIGSNYVIAREFHVSTWWSAGSAPSQKRFSCALVG